LTHDNLLIQVLVGYNLYRFYHESFFYLSGTINYTVLQFNQLSKNLKNKKYQEEGQVLDYGKERMKTMMGWRCKKYN